jgi:HSP20 family protein
MRTFIPAGLFQPMLQPNFNSISSESLKTNIIEYEDRFEMQFLMPGYTKEDIEIALKEDNLVIKSIKEATDLPENAKVIRSQFVLNSFEKNLSLNLDLIDTDKIQANLENGILKMNLPKREEQLPKAPIKISVN